MNVAKNWALTIMLIALAFAHFSSELLLKEQMIILVKKNVHQRWSYRRKICQKKFSETGCFLLIVSWQLSSRDFLRNCPIFLTICPWKSFKNWIFFPLKSREIRRFFCEFWLFSCEIGWLFREFWLFSREFPSENPAKFCFFSTKYQRPCLVDSPL